MSKAIDLSKLYKLAIHANCVNHAIGEVMPNA